MNHLRDIFADWTTRDTIEYLLVFAVVFTFVALLIFL